MPRVKRRQHRRRAPHPEASEGIRGALLSGHYYGFLDGNVRGKRPPPEVFAEAWAVLRGQIMDEWIAEKPGTRPWAWWEFDAPEPRRRADGKPHPFANADRNALISARHPDADPTDHHQGPYRLYFGVPGILIARDDFSARYETERDYLDRLNLLTDREREG